MLNSKFDLYKAEWLDLVFAERNQTYGAYDLRKHYNDTMLKAMGITFFGIAVLSVSLSIAMRHKAVAVTDTKTTVVKLDNTLYVAAPKKTEPAKAAAAPKVPPVAQIKYVTMLVTTQPTTVEPPKVDLITSAVGPVDVKVPGGGEQMQNALPAGPGGGGVDSQPAPETTYESGIVQVMPEPVGGQEAWSRFLQKNLRYPYAASEQGIQGKVFVSFIIEKDGHLSDITVLRPVGHGFDEESLRVLKLAPKWIPGKQNGQNVRVRYTLPITFQLGDQN